MWTYHGEYENIDIKMIKYWPKVIETTSLTKRRKGALRREGNYTQIMKLGAIQ